MRIPYKLTSGIALATSSLAVVSEFLPPPPRKPVAPSVDGAVGWDPCMVWVQYGPMERLTVLVGFGAFLLFTARGLRNRPGPRWMAIVGVLTVLVAVASDWWRVAAGCYSTASLMCSFTAFSAVAIMFLHHALQPRPEDHIRLQNRRFRSLAYRGILPASMSIPVAWAGLNVFKALDHPQLEHTVVDALQRSLSWAEVVLFPFAAAVGFRRLVTWLEGIRGWNASSGR